MAKEINLREIIMHILIEVLDNGQYSNILIRQTLDKFDYLDTNKKAFIKRVSEGTIETLLELDYIISQFTKTKIKKMKPDIRAVLRMSVYQILYMDSVPDSAVCNEAVKLIKASKYRQLSGFVNGILREICRNKNEIKYPSQNDQISYISIKYSVSEFLVKKLFDEIGNENAIKVFENYKESPKITVRVNKNAVLKEELISLFEERGICVESDLYFSDALRISNFGNLSNLDLFRDGYFYVMDQSSMYVTKVADPKGNEFCLDVCAAPGGKALHMAESLNNGGLVEARDISENKTYLIEENARRLKIKNIKIKEFNATVYDEELEGKVDILICDLPCSGLGIAGKKQEIKYRINQNDIDELQKIQREILCASYKYLKKGGTLIYSTCTISKEENIENYFWILENLPFSAENIAQYFPDDIKTDTCDKGYIQFLPGVQDLDGFFIAKFKKL